MSKYHRMMEFDTGSGKKAMSFQVSIRDMATYPDREPGFVCNDDMWPANPAGEFVRKPYDIHDARKIVDEFVFPAKIKTDAQRASRHLVSVFEDVAKLLVVKDQVSGRLDRRKLGRLVETSLTGQYKVEEVRPYRRTQMQTAKRPMIAIVASSSFVEMWHDAAYVPRVLTLTLGILWACEACQLDASAALMQATPYSKAMKAVMLAETGRTTPLKAYAACLQSDMFRKGLMTMAWADTESLHLQRKWGNGNDTYKGHSWSSRNGGNAVQWAREVLQADVVIAIGDISDHDDADFWIGGEMSLDKAVKEIARQAAKL